MGAQDPTPAFVGLCLSDCCFLSVGDTVVSRAGRKKVELTVTCFLEPLGSEDSVCIPAYTVFFHISFLPCPEDSLLVVISYFCLLRFSVPFSKEIPESWKEGGVSAVSQF